MPKREGEPKQEDEPTEEQYSYLLPRELLPKKEQETLEKNCADASEETLKSLLGSIMASIDRTKSEIAGYENQRAVIIAELSKRRKEAKK